MNRKTKLTIAFATIVLGAIALYAQVFNYDAATGKFTADPSPADCGNTRHLAVKSKDYIFHPYEKR